MDPRQTGEMIGRMIPMLLGIGACVWVGVRASSARPGSRRLAGLGLAFGLAVIPLLALATFARGGQARGLLVGVGAAAVVAGVVALWLGVKAGSARGREDGEGGSSGMGALVTGALGVVVGLGVMVLPFLANPPATTAPWAYRIEPPGVELTLPSDRWQKQDRANYAAFFACRLPQMGAGVGEVRPANTPEDFGRAVDEMKRVVARTPARTLDERRGPNAHGHEHWVYVGEEETPNGRVLVGMSVTWWKKSHAVIMIFEGQHRMRSQVGQGEEAEGFRAAAATILGSVK